MNAQGRLTIVVDGNDMVLHGPATLADTARLDEHVRAALSNGPPGQELRIDLSQVPRLDTAAAYILITRQKAAEAAGGGLEIIGAKPEVARLLRRVGRSIPEPEADGAAPGRFDWLAHIGEAVLRFVRQNLDLVGYFGLFLARLVSSILNPRSFRMTALVHHCQEVGLKAVPIVALMSFLIGVVLAFQGSAQLRQFGAEVFVVDLIAISILRELGILLTAIIVAGRTASAFTAAIGSMKMREEIDAMQTLGLDHAAMLFVPRILALVITLPILGLIADLAGLFGGGLMSWIELGISPQMFVTRLLEVTDVRHVFVGMIKAPVFALIIGVIGCRAGMAVRGNAESLGQKTSTAVVASIFAVIVADAIFSVFFAQVGI